MRICQVKGCTETEQLQVNSRVADRVYYMCRSHSSARKARHYQTEAGKEAQRRANQRY